MYDFAEEFVFDKDPTHSHSFGSFEEAIAAYNDCQSSEKKLEDFVDKISNNHDGSRDYFLTVDSHLNSPLIDSDPLEYLQDPKNIRCPHHRFLIESLSGLGIEPHQVEQDTDGILITLFDHLKSTFSSTPILQAGQYSFFQHIRCASDLYQLSSSHWYQTRNDTLADSHNQVPKSLDTWFKMFMSSRNFKLLITRPERKQRDVTKLPGSMVLIGSYFLVSIDLKHFVLKINYLIAALDIFVMQFNARFISWISGKTSCMTILEYPIVDEFLNYMEIIVRRNKNKGYKVFKNLEALIVGAILDVLDPNIPNQLYSSTVEDLVSEGLIDHKEKLLLLIGELKQFDEGRKTLLNLVGLSKAWGNPTIDSLKGVEKLKQLTRDIKCLDDEVLNSTRATFRKRFCKEYFRKHGKFPEVRWTEYDQLRICPKLKNVVNTRRWFNEDQEPKMTDKDWLSFKFEKTLPFDFMENIEKILSDKAISPPLSDWSQDYCKCAFSRSGQARPVFNRNTTRLMNFILESPTNFSMEELFKKIAFRDIPIDWCRIKLQDKELELNDVGRKFSTQTPLIRLWQTISEYNIAKGVMKYLNYQSMTIGEIKTEQRVTSMAKLQSCPTSSKLYFVNLDLEKWNMCFRWKTCHGIAEDMEDLFGLPGVIDFSHEFFQQCTFTYPSSIAPQIGPNGLPMEGHGCHIGQPGGCEGLRQKLWTAITAGVIDSSADMMSIAISLLCQGDNQTFLARIREGEEDKIISLSELISNRLEKAGMKLKSQETWISQHLVSYSKKYYLDGVAVDDYLKTALRVCGDQNSDFPCLLNELGTISTGGESVAKSSSNPLGGYVLAMLHTSIGLTEELKLSIGCDDVKAIMLSGPIIGCYPISQFSNYCVRGNPDPLTDMISRYKWLKRNHQDVAASMERLFNLSFGRSDSLRNIIKDPLSLNLKIPVTPTVGIEILLKGILRKRIKYPRYKELYAIHSSDDRRLFLDKLVMVDKLFPIVLNKIFSMSPFGVLERLEARFDNTNSLIKLISKEYSFHSLKAGVEVFVASHRRGVMRRIRAGAPHKNEFMKVLENFECSFTIAQELRNQSWGVTVHGVTSPCPVEQVVIKPWCHVTQEEEGWTITLKISDSSVSKPTSMHTTVGPFVPYLGSETSEKINIVKTPSGRLLSDSSMENLRKLYVWLSKGTGPNTIATLKNIMMAMIPDELCEGDNEVLTKILQSQDVEVYGGCWTHRMSTNVTNSGCYLNQKYNPSTHMQFSPTNASRICKGAANRTIFFQNLQIYGVSCLSMMALTHQSLYPSYAIVINCMDCSREVPNETFNHLEVIPLTLKTPFTVSEVEYVSELSEDFEESAAMDPSQSLSYYLATKCKRDFDLYIRAQDTQAGLHQLISARSPASSNYNKTEVSSCNIKEVLQILIEIYPEIRDHITTLESVVSGSIELMIRSSSWIPLLNIATAMIGTDRIRLLLTECKISNTQFLLGFNKYRVVSLLYSVLRKLCRYPIHVPSVVHLTESKFEFHKRMLFYIKKHNLQSENSVASLLSNQLITAQILLDNPDACNLLRNHIYFVNNIDSCLFRWRNDPVVYSGIPTSMCDCISISCDYVQTRVEFEDTEFSSEYDISLRNCSVPSDRQACSSKYSHHYRRNFGNISTSCSKQFDLLSALEASGFDLSNSTNLFCADGAGSMMVATMHKYPNSFAMFNTLIKDSEYPQGNPDTYLPACVISDCHDLESRILSPRQMTLGVTDVFDPLFPELVTSQGYMFDLINIDVETPGVDVSEKLAGLIINLLPVTHSRSVFVVRYHITSFSRFTKVFSTVTKYLDIIKPFSSSFSTEETYLIIPAVETQCTIERVSHPPTLPSIRRYEDFCNKIDITTQLDFSLLVKVKEELNIIEQELPCLSMLTHDMNTLGVSTVNSVAQDLEREMNLCISNLCMMGYEITKRTSEHMVARMLRDSNREVVIGHYIRKLLVAEIILGKMSQFTPLEFSTWVCFKVLSITVIFNTRILRTYIFINEDVPHYPGDVVIYQSNGTVEDLLGNYVKLLFRVHLKIKVKRNFKPKFKRNIVRRLIVNHSEALSVEKGLVTDHHKRFFMKVIQDLSKV